jgi:hypothetical protein
VAETERDDGNCGLLRKNGVTTGDDCKKDAARAADCRHKKNLNIIDCRILFFWTCLEMEERATVGTIDTIVWSAKHEMKKFVKMSLH